MPTARAPRVHVHTARAHCVYHTTHAPQVAGNPLVLCVLLGGAANRVWGGEPPQVLTHCVHITRTSHAHHTHTPITRTAHALYTHTHCTRTRTYTCTRTRTRTCTRPSHALHTHTQVLTGPMGILTILGSIFMGAALLLTGYVSARTATEERGGTQRKEQASLAVPLYLTVLKSLIFPMMCARG